tara:strand:- start:3591 stop:4460 length:870 start_codon:yes stop_codon:yes gene_type:complete
MNSTRINGLKYIASQYDTFVIDIWGVLHGGGPVYPEALHCLNKIQELNKKIIFLSNAPRLSKNVYQILIEKGMPDLLCKNIITSGEATLMALVNRTKEIPENLGTRYFIIGPKSENLLHTTNYTSVKEVKDADFFLAIGLNSNTNSIEEHEELLVDGVSNQLKMICVNPDIKVLRFGKSELCAGALATRYKKIGGDVIYFGKPYSFIYSLCVNDITELNKERLLCIGDGLKTDILGANKFGTDSLLITGGLMSEKNKSIQGSSVNKQEIERACKEANVTTKWFAENLCW